MLLELIQPFQTDMERYKVIGQLRAGHIHTDLTVSYPSLVNISYIQFYIVFKTGHLTNFMRVIFKVRMVCA